jgi:hypothetical protein
MIYTLPYSKIITASRSEKEIVCDLKGEMLELFGERLEFSLGDDDPPKHNHEGSLGDIAQRHHTEPELWELYNSE